ncbi:MAG: LamG domain-containing protein [Patescibacteria group bacterium]
MPISPKKTFIFPSIIVLLFLVSTYIVFAQNEGEGIGQTSLSGKICPEPPSGLVSRWNGDTVTGKTASEMKTVADMKARNNGTIHGGVTIRSWENGNNFHPDGSSGYIRMENSKSLNFGTGPFSLEVWFRLGLRGSGIPAGNIIRKSNYPVRGPGYGYWLKAGGDDRMLEFFAGESAGISGESRGKITTTINTDTWYHVVATRDGSGTMKLYVDGKLKGTAEAPGANTTSEAPFTLGAWDRGGAAEPFFGVIGGVSVYNRTLSQSEIVSTFNVGNDSRCQSYLGSEPQTSEPRGMLIPEPVAIAYPVVELGSCGSQEDCKTYCSVSSNYSKCVTFAKKVGLTIEVPEEKKGVFAAMEKGESPGQCKDEVACRTYCEDIDHLEECVNFVEKFKLASADELKEIRKITDVKKAGVAFPGNCKTKESCLKYCENSANAVVCMEFAQKAGFIPKEDAEAVNKILPYLKSGGKLPGGCTTKESCDAYCASDTHTNECIDFAVKVGFMTREEADIVKKTGGKGPGNCRSREACDSYCKSEAHIDECVDFAVRAGFISKEEAEMAKKFKITSGPGGCKSKADCEAFCVINQDTCFNWAKDHGMLSEEDLKNIEEQRKFMTSLDKAPPEWLACMEKELGPSFFGRFKAGKITQSEAKSPALETAQRKCESLMGQDIRKEIEVCLSKATCAEFNSCFDALPKGNQQSSGQEGPQDESGKKVQARALSCLREKIDICLAFSCSEFDACMKSLQQGGDQAPSGQPQAQGTPDPKVNAKVQACQKEKVNACLTKSCGEFQACLNSLGGGGGDGEQQQGTPDPSVQAKFQSCQPKGGDSGVQQQQGGDQSAIPQGYSSWEEFCKANIGDSRCTAYQSQTPTSGDGGADFTGPGGCKTPEECQAYCMQNYQDPACQQFGPGSMIEPVNQGFFAQVLSAFGPLLGIR